MLLKPLVPIEDKTASNAATSKLLRGEQSITEALSQVK
jgi:hypothetical protein